MSRDDGFPIADVDSSYFEDSKLRELWRRIRDEADMARAVCLHKSTLLASWRQGERVTVQQAAPLWLTDDPDLIAHLQACDLLDAEQRIPDASFGVWFGAAQARRELRRASGRAGGLASAKGRSTKRSAKPKQPFTDAASPAEPVRPSVKPSVRPSNKPSASDARDGLPHVNSTVAAIWEQATGRTLLAASTWAQSELDNMCRRLPPSEVGAAILRARKEYGDRIPDERALVMTMLRLPEIGKPVEPRNVEDTAKRSAAARRQMQLTMHSGGHHIDAPDPDCPKCAKGAAA